MCVICKYGEYNRMGTCGVGESSASLGTRCLILFSATFYIHSK